MQIFYDHTHNILSSLISTLFIPCLHIHPFTGARVRHSAPGQGRPDALRDAQIPLRRCVSFLLVVYVYVLVEVWAVCVSAHTSLISLIYLCLCLGFDLFEHINTPPIVLYLPHTNHTTCTVHSSTGKVNPQVTLAVVVADLPAANPANTVDRYVCGSVCYMYLVCRVWVVFFVCSACGENFLSAVLLQGICVPFHP